MRGASIVLKSIGGAGTQGAALVPLSGIAFVRTMGMSAIFIAGGALAWHRPRMEGPSSKPNGSRGT